MKEQAKFQSFLHAGHGFEPLGCNVLIKPDIKKFALAAGLADFDSFFNNHDMKTIKHVRKERATYHLKKTTELGEIDIYIKKTTYNQLTSWLKSKLKFKNENPSALYELENLLAFKKAGLPVAEPVAAGAKKNGRLIQTFIATHALPATTRLSDYIISNWSNHPDTTKTASAKKGKNALIERLATIAKRMHGAGFNHRDFYLVHFLLDETSLEIYLLDLNRAQKRTTVPHRWIVKDLAALDYSAGADNVSNTDRIRFLCCYLEKKKLGNTGKALARKIRRKSESMRAHSRKAKARDREFIEKKGGVLS